MTPAALDATYRAQLEAAHAGKRAYTTPWHTRGDAGLDEEQRRRPPGRRPGCAGLDLIGPASQPRKVGDRFAALEPVAQGLRRRCGSVEADAARSLSLRMDHGSQYLSDHFLNQVRYWGIRPSFGLLKEPETNGVVERWNRTLKEQAVYGRVFQNLAEVRAAVAEFVERYNRCWRLEKLAYRTPLEAREEYELRQAA